MIAPMTAATRNRRAKASRPRRVSLREDFHGGIAFQPLKVENGVIFGVKILGWESANGRHYLPEAAKSALGLYEGAKCYSNHPDRATQSRENDDALGIWRNARWTPEGVFADLHYLETHPMAARVVEDARRGLGVFGASHNADGDVERRDSMDVVYRITEVRSVDIVNDPATVTNLRESKAIKVKIKSFLLEKCAAALSAGRLKRLKALCEDMGDEREMEADESGDHRDHLYAAMRACEDEGDSDKAGKIHKLFGPEKDETEEGEGDPAPDEGTPSDDGDTSDDGGKKEGKKPKAPAAGSTGLTEARAKALCKLAGIEPKAEVLEAVVGLDEAKAVSVLTLAKGQQPTAGKSGTSAPRSSSPASRPVVESKMPASAEEQAKALLR